MCWCLLIIELKNAWWNTEIVNILLLLDEPLVCILLLLEELTPVN